MCSRSELFSLDPSALNIFSVLLSEAGGVVCSEQIIKSYLIPLRGDPRNLSIGRCTRTVFIRRVPIIFPNLSIWPR